MIANRQVDVWEVAFVWAWPVPEISQISSVEAELFHQFEHTSRLMNGTVPAKPKRRITIPERESLQVLPNDEIARRKEPRYRFPRQAQQVALLLDYILETFDKKHLRRSLHAHFERLERYYRTFQGDLMREFDEQS